MTAGSRQHNVHLAISSKLTLDFGRMQNKQLFSLKPKAKSCEIQCIKHFWQWVLLSRSLGCTDCTGPMHSPLCFAEVELSSI
jgi:hypothetical protein